MQVFKSRGMTCLVGTLLASVHIAANAQIVSSDSGNLSQDLALLEFVSEPVVKRHRLVQIDYEAIYELIVAAPSDYEYNSHLQTESFVLELFEDVRATIRFRYSYRGPDFLEGELVEGESAELRIRGTVSLNSKKKTNDGSLSIDDRQYVISPTSQSPNHLVWEAYPDLMPNFD